ncbi:hypothetical protein VTO42DRAFT_3128 [Malbranchea cinnamomea]
MQFTRELIYTLGTNESQFKALSPLACQILAPVKATRNRLSVAVSSFSLPEILICAAGSDKDGILDINIHNCLSSIFKIPQRYYPQNVASRISRRQLSISQHGNSKQDNGRAGQQVPSTKNAVQVLSCSSLAVSAAPPFSLITTGPFCTPTALY